MFTSLVGLVGLFDCDRIVPKYTARHMHSPENTQNKNHVLVTEKKNYFYLQHKHVLATEKKIICMKSNFYKTDETSFYTFNII